MSAPVVYFVIPCYNEEEVILQTAARLKEKTRALIDAQEADAKSRIVFVNDGSSDSTWEKIRSLHQEDAVFSGICLSRNRGHQNALLAGLLTVCPFADVTISMDADLQDDVDAVDAMLAKYKEGKDIVYGVRSDRSTDTFFKRTSAGLFYSIMRLMGTETIDNHADFRLMSARAVEALSDYKEVNLFLRGMIPLLGFESDVVYYERAPRLAGESKYPLSKMIHFAMQGVTSLTTRPIQFITRLGLVIFLMSIVMLIYSLVRHFTGATITGWSSLMVSLWAIGGLILLSLGIIGEYIGKIYLETKERPRFLVAEFLDEEHGFVYGQKP
ncbi:MAG: glycosyltransferase family 2 protein [Lachnospiraceae bacterium]|nr:glycosyltransferase family 2 protein [Lachnospiraceae bacterium]